MNTNPHQYPVALQFEGVHFDVVERDNEPWLRVQQIAVALGYSRPDVLQQVYKSNASEFTADMTALVKLPTAGGEQTVRVFSLRGAHLLGMFARTEKAKAFRRWVLDVLEATARQQPAPTVEASELLHTLRLCRDAQSGLIALQAKEIERLHAEANRPKQPPRKPLTKDELQMIRALAAQGMRGSEIARRVGRSPATVSMAMRTVTVTREVSVSVEVA